MISDALHTILAAGRPHFNARAAEVRHRYPSFDYDDFAAFLRDGLDPVVCAVAEEAPERVGQAATDGFDIALELVAQRLAGPRVRQPWVNRVWSELAPRYAALLAREPQAVLGALTNAVVHLGAMPGVRVDAWLSLMAGLAQWADSVAHLRQLGQIAAWRAGMAHFRAGALRAADALPEAAALAAVGAKSDEQWETVRATLEDDPWWDVASRCRASSPLKAGGFTGFGGRFPQPPSVRVDSDVFVIRSADRYALLIADVHGAVLLPATEQEFTHAKSGQCGSKVFLDGARLNIDGRIHDLDLPRENVALVSSGHTVVVSSPYSHTLTVFPR